jgi:hypothetical protein
MAGGSALLFLYKKVGVSGHLEVDIHLTTPHHTTPHRTTPHHTTPHHRNCTHGIMAGNPKGNRKKVCHNC